MKIRKKLWENLGDITENLRSDFRNNLGGSNLEKIARNFAILENFRKKLTVTEN